MFNTILNIVFPKVCGACGGVLSASDNTICIACRHDLPLVGFHKNGSLEMNALFYGRVPVQHTSALLRFQKRGITQELLHNLKYRKQEHLSYFFGSWLGAELAENEAYRNIDLVIPVPLHRFKKRKRGYNQVAGFGIELAKALDANYADDILVKVFNTRSQVFKGRFNRMQDNSIFTIQNAEKLNDKHVLLVDDIITTGATLENCANKILEHSNAKISIATIAISEG